jgi:hypothetical protein
MSRQENLDNYSRQLDPENDAFWQSRGYDRRPENWKELLEEEEEEEEDDD